MQARYQKWIMPCLLAGYVLTWPVMALPTQSGHHAAAADGHLPAEQAPSAELLVTESDTDTIAASFDPAASPLLQDWIAVDTHLLQEMRGGFTADSGLKVSFGIERIISINGELHTATRFGMEKAGTFSSSQAAPQGSAGSAVQLIQNGLQNSFAPGQLSQAAAATFIQNSLNDQTIQSVTVINATSNSLELLRSMNLHSALQDALTHSATQR